MELFNWIAYPSEYRYLTIVFGCKRNPSVDALSLLRLCTVTQNRYPTIDEFLLFVVKECEPECEYYIPPFELLHLTRYSLVEYGFIARCRIAHYLHSFQIFEQRYPTTQEIYQYVQSERGDSTELMQRDAEEYWEKKQSSLTEQDIYKYVQNNEEKEVMCCVCQETIAEQDLIVKLNCNHVFHRGSSYKLSAEERTSTEQTDCQGVEEWLKRSATCPICRVPVKEA